MFTGEMTLDLNDDQVSIASNLFVPPSSIVSIKIQRVSKKKKKMVHVEMCQFDR